MASNSIFPDEIMVEILLKLPVKSILRCNTLSKHYYSLIHSQYFIRRHLTLGRLNDNFNDSLIVSPIVDSLRLFNRRSGCFAELEFLSSLVDNVSKLIISGPIDGVYCVIDDENVFRRVAISLWNPATLDQFVLPATPLTYDEIEDDALAETTLDEYLDEYLTRETCLAFGFGLDIITNNYKVVIIYGYISHMNNTMDMYIFNVSERKWRYHEEHIAVNSWRFTTFVGVFLGGACHWICPFIHGNIFSNFWYPGYQILAFDMSGESSRAISFPDVGDGYALSRTASLATLDGCLALIEPCGEDVERRCSSFNVWVMAEYGVAESWSTMYQVSLSHGSMIGVWDEPWLPGNNGGIIPTPNLEADPSLKVADLIDWERACWKIELVKEVLTEEEVKRVLQLPISRRLPEDQRFWWPTKEGCYTVKSGYWLGRGSSRPSLNFEDEEERMAFWRLIWKLKVPPKLVHFTWRMCINILAVKKSLYSKHCLPSPICSFCREEEDIDHAIFKCEWARRWWDESGFSDLINAASGENNCTDRVGWVLKHLDENGRGRFLTIAWAIWTVRNQRLFEESPPLPEVVFTGLAKMVADYRAIATCVLNKPRMVSVVGGNSWCPPPAGTIKINSDAYLVGNGEVGLGAVARDMAGNIIWVGSKRVMAGWEVEVAEARAAVFGLEVAMARGMANIILESDASNLVKAVKNPQVARTPFGLCVEDLCILLNLFSSSSVSHVKREGNAVAHLVARMCEVEGDEIVLDSAFPQAITAVADLDLI